MSQYYYILNSRPNKPNMRPVKNTKQSIPVQFVEKKITEVKVEEMSEFDVKAAKEHLQPLQQDAVAEPAVEVVEQTIEVIEEIVEETPKKKKRGRKKAEEETEA